MRRGMGQRKDDTSLSAMSDVALDAYRMHVIDVAPHMIIQSNN